MDRWTSKIQLRDTCLFSEMEWSLFVCFCLYQRCKEAKLMSAVAGAKQKEALHNSSASQSHSLLSSFPDSVWNQIVYLKSLIYILEYGPCSFGGKEQHNKICCNPLLLPTKHFSLLCFLLSKPSFCSATAFSPVDQCPEKLKRLREEIDRKM